MKCRFRNIVFLSASLIFAAGQLSAQDKSASSVIQLPSSGGTVTHEEGALTLNSNTGSANFSLPFPDLPQRGRLGPNIQLSYNQFSGDSGSGLGVGWRFSLPVMQVNEDLGTAIPGQTANGDLFNRVSYNGTRLIFLGEEAGLARYRLEFSQQPIEILRHDAPIEVAVLDRTGTLVTETLAGGFEVRQPDGSRLYFSADPAVAEGKFGTTENYTTRWPLVLQVNANRDAIHYSYEKHSGRSYLTQVSYAGGQSVHRFELIDTRPSLVTHATGTRQQNAKLYGRVTHSFRGTVYDQWCMGYIGRDVSDNTRFTVRAHPDCLDQARADLEPLIDTNSVNVLDQLRVFYRYGDTGGAPLEAQTLRYPDITFDYSSWTASELAARNLVFEAPNLEFVGGINPLDLELADLNMDALTDIVRTTPDGAMLLAGSGDLDAAFDAAQATQIRLTRTSRSGLTTVITPRLADDRFHFADVMGDSYVDIIEIADGEMHIYNGNALGDFPYIGRSIALPLIAPQTFAGGNGRFIDINMDGRSDIVSTRLNANGETEWQILLNLTRRQPDGGNLVNFTVVSKAFPFFAQSAAILGQRNVRLTDINGDRLPDLIVIRVADQGFCVYENQGNIFSRDPDAFLFGEAGANDPLCGNGRFTHVGGMQPTDNLQSMWYVDANGDGIVDFASIGSSPTEFRLWLGFGDGSFIEEPLELTLNERVQVSADASAFRSRVADLDADGQTEIIVFQSAGGSAIKPAVLIDFNRTGDSQLVKANLLTVVNFGTGRRHDIRYATSTDEMLRDRAQGREIRALHFPVVVVKQIVTSEGSGSEIRQNVQTEEFFYHNPFYDVINHRFIGFSEVERVVYGDEFEGGEVTQTSALMFEQYHTFADTAPDLHLAGKLKIRKTFEIQPGQQIEEASIETASLDPMAVALHSLSTRTRREGLPEPGSMLSCESSSWIAVPRPDGTNWLRKTSDQLTTAVGPQQMQDIADPVCANPTKEIRFSEFDAFNIHGREVQVLRKVNGPLGLVVPGSIQETEIDYSASRAGLAGLGIVNAASERRTVVDGEQLGLELFTYNPGAGGRLSERILRVFSRLAAVPVEFADLHAPSHDLVKSMGHDVFGNVISMSDGLGTIEAVSFDPTGTLPLTHTRFAGSDPDLDQVTTLAYDGPKEGRISTETSPIGMAVSYEYDALGRIIAERAADGAERLYNYRLGFDGKPSMILSTRRRYANAAETPAGESENIQILAVYNARGNQIASLENSAEGGVRIFQFAEYNRNQQMTFKWTPFTIDSFAGQSDLDVAKVFRIGEVPRPAHAVGNAYVFDGVGRRIMETHPSGKRSEQSYFDWGTLTRTFYDDEHNGAMVTEERRLFNDRGLAAHVVGDGRGTDHVTLFERDTFGNLSSVLLPGEPAPRSFIHNSAGDLERQIIPGLGAYHYFYDSRGRQSTRVRHSEDGETQVVSFEYDFLNRKLVERENGVVRMRFSYDRGAQLVSAAAFSQPIAMPLDEFTEIRLSDPNGLFDTVQRFGYDLNGRMVQNEVTIGGQTFSENFHHTLDGRIDSATGPGGLSSHFALGPDQNLLSVTIEHPDFAGPETVIEQVLYNAEGRIRRIDYRGDAFTDLTYDPQTLFLTRIASEAGGLMLQNLGMVFNQNGSITTIEDRLAATGQRPDHVDRSGRFVYDFKNQLVEFARYGREDRFSYSAAGALSRNDEFAEGATLSPEPGAATSLIPVGTPDKPYAFDGFGQLASTPRIEETTFDAYGRMIRSQTAEHEVFYGYDQSGRRTYKRIVPRDGADPQVYLYPMISFHVTPSGNESFVSIGASRLVRMEHGTGRWFYYLKDHLESSDYVIASDGMPVEQMLYRAYGTEHRPEDLSQAWADHVVANIDALPREKTRHRFTGQYLDDDTGLYYFGARYYDPHLGRFISPDPLYLSDPERCVTTPIGCGLYAYASNNPMAFIDPTGLKATVAGDEAYRRQVEENLQRIDPTARVDMETGEVSQSWLHGLWLDIVDFFVPGSGYDTGRDLVSRLVEDEQTATIQYARGIAGGGPTDASVDFHTTPGDFELYYDPAYLPPLPERDPDSGARSYVVPDPGVVLGHEIIHATHFLAGDVSSLTGENYTGLDGRTYRDNPEETRTTGVGGHVKSDDITENQLREMLGLNPRNHYTGNGSFEP